MSSASDAHAPVVTLAALYGAAGAVIGARVAERLGVPFLDRNIPDSSERGEDQSLRVGLEVGDPSRSRLERMTAGLGRLSTITGDAGGTHERLEADEREVRNRIEGFLADASRGGGVALGRGGMVILRSVPWALHVHLGGPFPSRIEQAMAAEGVDRATAGTQGRTEDRARASYVRRVYGVDAGDPALYHLMLDGTALDVDVCVELIVVAATARARNPRSSPPI